MAPRPTLTRPMWRMLGLAACALALISCSSGSGDEPGKPAQQPPATTETGDIVSETLVVPDVVGLSTAEAVELLDSAGLTATGPDGVVVGQQPREGSRVPAGTAIVLQVDAG